MNPRPENDQQTIPLSPVLDPTQPEHHERMAELHDQAAHLLRGGTAVNYRPRRWQNRTPSKRKVAEAIQFSKALLQRPDEAAKADSAVALAPKTPTHTGG